MLRFTHKVLIWATECIQREGLCVHLGAGSSLERRPEEVEGTTRPCMWTGQMLPRGSILFLCLIGFVGGVDFIYLG